jgi:hypothetical protein
MYRDVRRYANWLLIGWWLAGWWAAGGGQVVLRDGSLARNENHFATSPCQILSAPLQHQQPHLVSRTGAGIGVIIDGCPAGGITWIAAHIQAALTAAAQLKRPDHPARGGRHGTFSPLFEGVTTGTPYQPTIPQRRPAPDDYCIT